MSIRTTLVRSAVALTMAAGALPAQAAHRTSFGVLLGGAAAKLANVDVESADLFNGLSTIKNRYGFQAGVYMNRSLGTVWSVQPEVHYVQKGTRLDVGGSSPVGSLAIDLAYVEVPLLVRADLGKAPWHPFLTAGPTLALRVGCDATLKSGISSLSVECKELDDNGTKRDPFETTDIGASIGAGFAGRLGGRRVLMQLRYGRGFTTVVKDDGSSTGTKQSPKNSVISLVLGLGN